MIIITVDGPRYASNSRFIWGAPVDSVTRLVSAPYSGVMISYLIALVRLNEGAAARFLYQQRYRRRPHCSRDLSRICFPGDGIVLPYTLHK